MLYAVTVVQNKRTGRFHPFFWRMAPMPSSDGTDMVCRYKSHCHHTAGFETAEEADTFVKENKEPTDVYVPGRNTTDYWLEDEVPARVTWFEVPA